MELSTPREGWAKMYAAPSRGARQQEVELDMGYLFAPSTMLVTMILTLRSTLDQHDSNSRCPVCNGASGLCYPSQSYVGCFCDKCVWDGSGIIATYQLPPFMIHEACLENPKCIGFRVRNDQTACGLWDLQVSTTDWHLVSDPKYGTLRTCWRLISNTIRGVRLLFAGSYL